MANDEEAWYIYPREGILNHMSGENDELIRAFMRL
jgi:hypothetical protein